MGYFIYWGVIGFLFLYYGVLNEVLKYVVFGVFLLFYFDL